MFFAWFVLESMFFVNPVMPFLCARQMLSFLCGILLAMNKNKIRQAFIKVFENKALTAIGSILYKNYFVHAFILDFVANDLISILIFIVSTLGLVALLYTALRKIKVGKWIKKSGKYLKPNT